MTKEEALKKIEENEKNISELKGYIEGLEKPKGVWKPEMGQLYYFDQDGGVTDWKVWEGDESDEYRYLTDNCFETERGVEDNREYKKALGTVTHYILEENGDWEADWSDENEIKHLIFYDYRENSFNNHWCYVKDGAQKIDYMSSSYLAREVISKFDKELRIIFKIK